MTEFSTFIKDLGKVSTLEDVEAILPPQLVDQLGSGEKGKQMVLILLAGLAEFAPEPDTFDINAFYAIVPFDETSKSLDENEATNMFQVAIQAGLIKKAEAEDSYMVPPQISAIAGRLF